MEAVEAAMLTVPKSSVNVERIKNELEIPNGVYVKAKMFGAETTGIPKKFKCYSETASTISVPRHYKVPWLGKPLARRKRIGGWTRVQKSLVKGFTPRPHQPPAIAALGRYGDKILAVRCGGGKTVMTLAAWAAHRTGPLLILVDTQELAKQWKEAAAVVCGITPDQIGSLKGPVEKWKGYPIVIGFVQTMWRRDYSQELYDYFQVVAYDEVHICGASRMQQVLPKFSGERWGLSATPDRSDGNTKLIKLHIGEVEYEDLEQELKPTVYFVQTPYTAPRWMLTRHWPHLKAMISSALAKKEERNRLVLSYIEKAASTDRAVLVLGDRIQQHQWWIKNSQYGKDSGLLVAAVPEPTKEKPKKKRVLTKAEREKALEKRVVYATSALAKKGLDKPELDTLILPIPYSDHNNLQQMFGRTQRTMQNKKAPFVVIFEDKIETMIDACDKIREYCATHDIEYKFIGKRNELKDVVKAVKKTKTLQLKRMFKRR